MNHAERPNGTKKGHTPYYAGYPLLLAVLLLPLLFTGMALAQEFTPPPVPAVPPMISNEYPEDADGNGVEDALEDRLWTTQSLSEKGAGLMIRATADIVLDTMTDVELVFNKQVTQEQIDTFLAMGGEITHMYRAVSYGWNGRIPLQSVASLPLMMGDGLVLVLESKQVIAFLDNATRCGRVRPVWASGFAGSLLGYDGDPSITVAIVDSGVDGTHTDLAGRQQYWKDYTTDGHLDTWDGAGHGSHVCGIAVGTGAAAGAAQDTVHITLAGDLSTMASGNWPGILLSFPGGACTFTGTAAWLGGGSTSFGLVYYYAAGPWWEYVSSYVSGTSPLTLPQTPTLNPSLQYQPCLKSNGGTAKQFVITAGITNYPGVGDGFNKLRGVAPACNWAGFRVLGDNNSGSSDVVGVALDDLVKNRVANNIKVANLSIGESGTPGINTSERQKVNTAANNGIVMCVAAGNNGANTTAATRKISDPGRAAYAITVAASSDMNRLTSYTSEGFTSPGSTVGQEEDCKPDVMAPGGSWNQGSSMLSVDSNTGDNGRLFTTDQQANDYTGMQGTSMATPFVAGCAALVVDAMQQARTEWSHSSNEHPLMVKMLLCATATESNANRENDVQNPTLNRNQAPADGSGFPVSKDMYEGYGMINPDAAIEAFTQTYTQGATATTALGPDVADRRAWAKNVSLSAGLAFHPTLTVPAGGDFDLYLYSFTPGTYGKPVLLASSANAGVGVAETFNYTPATSTKAILVVKRVSGSGTFSLASTDASAPTVTSVTVHSGLSVDVTFNKPMGAGVTTAANYTVSGIGKGTLAANPASVVLVSGNTYRLTWNSGEMSDGWDVTITVANVQDTGGLVIGTPNSGTHMGGGIGVAPTVASVVVRTARTVDVTFSEPMGWGATNETFYSLSDSGKGSLATNPASVALVSGSTYRLTWTSGEMLNGGNVTITVVNAQDPAGNNLGTPNSGTHTGGGIGVAPTVTVNQAAGQADPTGTSPINFTVVFSEAVNPPSFIGTGVVITGDAGGTKSVALTTSDNITWNAAVSGMTTPGTVVADIPAGAVTDLVGNANTAASTSTDNRVTWDYSGPTVVAVAVTGTPAVIVEFNKAMGDGVLTPANYTVSGTGKGNLWEHPATVTYAGGSSYELRWTYPTFGEMHNAGNITITVANVKDALGNTIGAQNSGTCWGCSFGVAPTVTAVAVQSGSTVDITFSEAMGPSVTANWLYTVSGTGKGSLSASPDTVVLVSGNTYRLTWWNGEMFNGGDITVAVTGVWDLAENAIGTPNSATHTGGARATAPLLSTIRATASKYLRIEFTEDMGPSVTTPGNYTVSGTGKGTLSDHPDTVTYAYGRYYDLNWSASNVEMLGGGDITITVANVKDLAGNPLGAPNSITGTGIGIGGRPTPTITLATGQQGVTTTSPINFKVYFGEWMKTETFTSIDVVVSGTAGGTMSAVLTGGPITWYAAVSGMTTSGTVYLSIPAGVATDLAGNPNLASDTTYVLWDSEPPTGTVVINAGAAVTNSTAVTLALSKSDGQGAGVIQMRFSNDGSTWSGWDTIAASKAWTLSSGDGVKTVYVQFMDYVGWISTATISDTIILDTTAPVISVTGANPATAECGAAYTDAGATATDNLAGDRTANIVTVNPVNTAVVGTYTVTYNVSDGNGNNAAQATRTVTVADTSKPIITRLGSATVQVERGTSYTDAGATAADACVGNLTSSIVTTNPVNPAVTGAYTVRYNVSDGHYAADEVTRVVNVVLVDHPPVITTCAPYCAYPACSITVPDLTGEVVATDDFTPAGSLVITQSPAANQTITGLGKHVVTITVTDGTGHASTCEAILELTAFDTATSTEKAATWTTNGTVTTMVASDDTLYIGGSFTWAGAVGGSGSGWTNLAAVDLATGTVKDWKPVHTGAITAMDLSLDDTLLYTGGAHIFNEVNIATRAIRAISTPSGTVMAVLTFDDGVYFANSLSRGFLYWYVPETDEFINVMRIYLAGYPLSLASSDGKLYVGEADRIETLSLGSIDTTVFCTTNGPVRSLAATCDTVFAGGDFTTIGGTALDRFATLDLATGTVLTDWAPEPNGPVNVLALTDLSLYAAGAFTTVDAHPYPGLIKFADPAPPTVTINQASSQADPVTVFPVRFTAVFSEPVTGFAWDDVTWNGTATGITGSVSGSGATYTITVTNCVNGTLQPTIAAGRCMGSAGNYNAASKSTDNTVTVATRSITVTAPTAGLIWGQGETKNITWTSTGTMTGNVSIFLTKSGVADKWLADAALSAGSASYKLSATQAPGTGYSVKIMWATNNAVCASSAAFTVEPRTYFTCTWPAAAGETWVQGEAKTVTWTQVGLTGDVAVYLAKSGVADRWLAQGPFSALQLSVTLPFTVATGSGYAIKLVSCSNATVTAVGANTFTVGQGVPFVVTCPTTSGETWTMGEVKTVTWVNHGLTGAVAIFMTKTGQADRWIAQPLATAQSETIRLPFTSLAAGTGWTIKMVYVPNNALTAVGANTITVVTASPIVITYPNGGSTQALVMGTKKTVTWNQTGLLDTGQVAIYLTNPGMADRWIAQPKATLGVYEVTIPTNLAAGASANYKVKLQYTLNNAWIDSSDSTFCITANPAVTSPAAGAVWTTPSTGKTVSWNMTALTAGTQVAVYLTKDAGMADRYLTQTLASDGTKLVNIPTGLAAGTDYHIKVQWITNTAITATSAAFQITP